MPKTKTRASEYIPAAEIPWLWKYFPASKKTAALPVIGHELVKISKEIGRPVQDTLSIVYNEVHVYHQDAVAELRRRLDADQSYLAKHRYEPLGF
jgi:hypothetical protein